MAFYISTVQFFIQSKVDVSYMCITIFKYSLRNFTVTTLR